MLRLLTLGSLAVHGAGGPLSGSAAQPRRLAVLVLIARGGARGMQRAKVVNLLWPDATEEQSRRAMAQAIYALRRDLGRDETIVGTQLLHLNGDVVWCDLVEFERALADGDRARAAEMYEGDFLDGFRLPGSPEFERWVDDERLAIQHRYHDAVEGLAKAAEAQNARDEAVRWWRRRSASEPLNARIAVATMQSLAAAGDRSAALKHAGIFEALVSEELAMPADREVVALAAQLRAELQQNVPVLRVALGDKIKSIAVLQFAILGKYDTADVERDWSDSLAEEILTSLLDVPSMTVVARSASFALGTAPTLASVRELNVSHVVEGCVRRTRTGLRVTVRLVETTDGRAVWWHRADRTHDDDHEELAALVARGIAHA